MGSPELNVITGAYGYTGKYITRRLLNMGKEVKTITGHPDRPHEFGDKVKAYPFNFDNPTELTKSLEGAATLFNTYWIRFNYRDNTYSRAVKNTKVLFRACKDAGVKKVVHVSITNPSLDSPLPYFSGKAELENDLMDSGLDYTIIRPTVIYGLEDILINNIAWLLRKFPVFGILGDGEYKLQPLYVEDMADLVVNAAQSKENGIIDAVGPDILTFNELVKLVAEKVGSKAWIMHLPPFIALTLSRIISLFVGDVVLTKDEADGLMDDLLISDKPPTGKTRLADWLEENVDKVGSKYASELKRHYK